MIARSLSAAAGQRRGSRYPAGPQGVWVSRFVSVRKGWGLLTFFDDVLVDQGVLAVSERVEVLAVPLDTRSSAFNTR